MKPGFYFDMPAEEYHADPCKDPSLNYSTGKALIMESPWHAHMQHPRLGGNRFSATPKMDRGNIVHSLLLNQPLGKIEIIEYDNYKKKSAQEIRDAAQEAGFYVMLRREYDEIVSNLPLIREHLAEADVDLTGHCEASMIWESDGIICRTRADRISDNLCEIIDLKCGEDANPSNLESHIDKMCYDLQGAVEIEAIETLRPDLVGRVTFSDVFIEMEYPFFVVRADHSESMLEVGRSKWKRAKALWNECMSSSHWPGYKNRITARATGWAYRREFGEVA